MKTRKNRHRRGITLMFVMSMIVLFLLLATTFVVVSSDFFRASKKRAIKGVKTIDGTAFVERAMYDLIRGPDLSNTTSPLRGTDLLSDMYGYGFKAVINSVETSVVIPASRDTNPTSDTGQLVGLILESEKTGNVDEVTTLRDGQEYVFGAADDRSGFFTGRIMTFVSGEAAGISARIVDYQIEFDSATPPAVSARKFIVLIPGRTDRGPIAVGSLVDSKVIVNGLAFSGVGAGGEAGSMSETSPVLDNQALEPNRIGETRTELTLPPASPDPGGYLALNVGPNESYDAPDYQNMFLSGYDSSGAIIPSFHRYSLAAYHGNSTAGGSSNRHMFSAFDLNGNNLSVDADNDGELDSIWIDPGYPIQTNSDGIHFKALVAYRVVDMDGRLNLNAVGNLADMNLAGTINETAAYGGEGYGPSEISLSGTGFLTALEYQNILRGSDTLGLPGRYGFGVDGVANSGDEVPGAAGRDEWSIKKLFGYPGGTNTVEKLFQSAPADIRGRFAIGTPTVPQFSDLNDVTFNNGLPITDFSISLAADDTFTNSPYESNFAPSPYARWESGDDDTPFSALELEGLLRPFDADSDLLASRMRELLPDLALNIDKRNSVTTDSFEVPVSPARTVNDNGITKSLTTIIREKITGLDPDEEELYIRELMAPELLAGMKMDINRVFGNGYDDNGNEVIDDPLETAQQTNDDQATAPRMDLDNDFQPGTNDDLARMKFAKRLYVLKMLVCEDEVSGMTQEEFRTAVAQWAINVVDFRDPDSIHTPFEFDLNPWDGWDVDGDVSTDEGGNRRVVWGAERPELLFSETSAHHDRAGEDLPNDNGVSRDLAGGDVDFDSRLVPRTSTFIELYNPWTQNSIQQSLPPELARAPANPAGVDLQRVSPGDDPVWRIAVKRDPADMAFLRTIYFTDISSNPPTWDSGDQFFTTHTIPVIPPGVFAVVGSSGTSRKGSGYRTTFGRITSGTEGSAASLELDDTRSIILDPSMDPTDDQIIRNQWSASDSSMVETTTKGIAIVMDGPRSLSLSDPDGGYPVDGAADPNDDGEDVGDGYAYYVPHDKPRDTLITDPFDLDAIWNNGTTDAFRTLYLQRLANPLMDFDAITNPYITIDVTPIDLLSFNGVQNDPANNNPNQQERETGGVNDGDTDFGSLERGENQPGNRMLFAWDAGNLAVEGVSLNGIDDHNFSYEFSETMGRTNDPYVTGGATEMYSWLTWNNRPYVSQLELANVPFVSSEYLTRAFSLRDTTMDPYVDTNPSPLLSENPSLALGSTFGHLLNFYGHDSGNNPVHGNFYRLFDFTEVASRYVGTEFWPNPDRFVNNPANFYSHYRYPGKINLNTIPNAQVYNAMMGSYAGTLSYGDFNGSRWKTTGGTEFSRPYRNMGEGNLVPLSGMVEENVDCGIYRRNDADNPLLDFNSTTPHNNSDRSAYFRNAMRQRMGNLTTTRSSVFAIWITVGYFEVDGNGALKNIPGGGLEVGWDTGEVVRNRGFFIFDRSIPVGYEPGKNHNVERGILVRSIID